MQRQSVIREDICFAAMEVAVDSSPGSGVTSSTPHSAGLSAQDPAGTFLPAPPRTLVTALERPMQSG
jgi:hypothetical protein